MTEPDYFEQSLRAYELAGDLSEGKISEAEFRKQMADWGETREIVIQAIMHYGEDLPDGSKRSSS